MKLGDLPKNVSKPDFEYKSVPHIQSNAKVIQKPSETITAPLQTNKKHVFSFTIITLLYYDFFLSFLV